MAAIRILVLLLLLLPSFVSGQTSSCLSANAGQDDTICLGQCSQLTANVSGTWSSIIYSGSTIPYAPYPFTGGNAVLVNLDDVWSPAINIPFCFEFYGLSYNQLLIGTNGIVTFDVSQANGNCPWSIGAAIPNPGLPTNSIMAPFHDIDPTAPTDSGATSINWNIYGVAPCRTMVINWNDVAMYGNGCDSLASTSQVVLHETSNIIDIFIHKKTICTLWNSGAAIEGIQNATGTVANFLPARNYPSVWSGANDAYTFKPAGPVNYTVQWLDPSGTVISTNSNTTVCPTQTTTYTLQVQNTTCAGNSPLMTDQVNIVVTQSNLSVTSTVIQPTCSNTCDGSITIFPTNGVPPYNVTWTPNVSTTTTASNLCTGTYLVSVTDATGCAVLLSFNLVPTPPFTLQATSTNSICTQPTGTATAVVFGTTGPFTYQWSTGDTSSSITNIPSGIYYVVVTDTAGCRDSIQVTVQSNGLNLTGQQTALLCNGDCNASVTVTPTTGIAPYTFTWSPLGGTDSIANNLCSGFYSCQVTDASGCSSAYTVTIANPPPVITVPNSNLTICLGDTVTITASASGGTPPYTFTWNILPPGPSHIIAPSQTTIYTVTATDANGCTGQPQSTLVKVNSAPTAAFTASPGACPPSAIYFTNATDSAMYYYWDFGDPASGSSNNDTNASPAHVYTTGGNYTITLIAVNAYGCSDTLTIPNLVSILPGPTAGLSASSQLLTTLDPVSSFQNSSSGAITYTIFYGDGDSLVTTSSGPYTHTYDSVGVYQVILVAANQFGCTDTAWVQLEVQDLTTCFIPNAFTPNNDGTNDLFMVYGENVVEFELLIFNRWGELIYSTSDIYHGWNGTYKDNRCQEDVYVWVLHYTDNLGGKHKEIGHVSLIR